MADRLVLGVDLGGTKTLFALARSAGGRLAIELERRYENAGIATFGDLLLRFLAEAGARAQPIGGACIGVAGPVEGGRAQVTNLPWLLDSGEVARALDGAPVLLLNDFAAAAHGVEALDPGALVTLQPGAPLAHAPQLVLGAGTGLGVAFRIWTGERYQVVPGEGGHCGFAPADATQAALAEWLRARFRRVTLEHVVSGPGLARIHAFLGERGAEADPAEITRAALERQDADALAAVDLFLSCYGAAAGDFALACLARGGVFVAGGIAPKLLPRLAAGGFIAAFRDKGAFAALAARFPVHVVTDERLGLLGALAAAARA